MTGLPVQPESFCQQLLHRPLLLITIAITITTTTVTTTTVITITVIIIITAIIPAVTAIRQKLQQLLHRRLPPLPRQIAIPMLIRLQLINYKILLKILLIKHY